MFNELTGSYCLELFDGIIKIYDCSYRFHSSNLPPYPTACAVLVTIADPPWYSVTPLKVGLRPV